MHSKYLCNHPINPSLKQESDEEPIKWLLSMRNIVREDTLDHVMTPTDCLLLMCSSREQTTPTPDNHDDPPLFSLSRQLIMI